MPRRSAEGVAGGAGRSLLGTGAAGDGQQYTGCLREGGRPPRLLGFLDCIVYFIFSVVNPNCRNSYELFKFPWYKELFRWLLKALIKNKKKSNGIGRL